jgi:iron complex transport system substrate-binding protein
VKLTYHPRRIVAAVLLVFVAATAVACGDDNDEAAATSTEPTSDSTAPAADDAAFPLTIEHKYGTTEIPAAPERVVSVGFTDQDFLLAIGVTPVGIRDWYGEQPFATWPWAQDELGDAEPEVLSSASIEYEKVAALRPDLIVGITSGMTDEEYEQLAAIAPTLPQSSEFVDYGVPWQEITRTLGQATGHSAEADAVIEEVEGLFATAADEHPEFAGATASVGALDPDIVYAYAPSDSRGTFMTDLGFAFTDEIVGLAGDKFYAELSAERLDLLDTDVLVWVTGTANGLDRLVQLPLYQGLDAVKEGRVVNLVDPELSGAMSFNSPLSIPYALEQIVPRLAAAIDGDPATSAD